MRALTASGLDLAELCPGPFALDGVETSSAAAAQGTGVHRQIAEWVATGRHPMHPRAEQAVLAIPALTQGAPSACAEVAFALDPETGEVRELGAGGGRDYSGAPAGSICGTVDLVAVGDGEVTVVDWKTGEGAAFNHGAPGEALQLLFGAYCAAWLQADAMSSLFSTLYPTTEAALRQAVRARVIYAFVTEEGVDPREAVVEPEQWPEVLARLRRVARGVAAARLGALRVRTGDHCGRCPAVLACPATRQAVQLLAPPVRALQVERIAIDEEDAGEIRRMLDRYVTGAAPAPAPLEIVPADPREAVAAAAPAQLAQALGAWRHLKRIGDAVEERAKLLAREGLLPGWRLVQRERREIHGGTAHRVLTEYDGAALARDACEVTTTQGRIKAALKLLKERLDALPDGPQPRGWLAREEREVMARIEAAGGIERKSYEQLVEDEQPALAPAEGAQEP